jgi:TRAP-type C4-dicarboxylate transport system substrate-binding protein
MGGPLCFIFINKAALDKIPPDVQAAWEKISEQQSLIWAKAYTDTDAKGRQAWKDLGKEVIPFPREEKAKLAKNLVPVWQAWIQKHEARGKPAKEIYKTYVEVMKREGKPVVVKIPELYQE